MLKNINKDQDIIINGPLNFYIKTNPPQAVLKPKEERGFDLLFMSTKPGLIAESIFFTLANSF